MRKIRGFKLTLRCKEIQRRAKKAKLDLNALGLGMDKALADILGRAAAVSRPAVIYDSFPADNPATPGLTVMPGLACTLCLATLGPDLDAFVKSSDLGDAFWGVVASAALDDTVRFVLGLIEEEAREERCELSPIQFICERPALEAVVSRLQGHKIGVALSETDLRPARSAAFAVSWLARAKSRAKL